MAKAVGNKIVNLVVFWFKCLKNWVFGDLCCVWGKFGALAG